MSAPENPPAFPFDIDVGGLRRYASGMTLRDYFAGRAITMNFGANMPASDQARHAYAVADAMLAERAKGGEA